MQKKTPFYSAFLAVLFMLPAVGAEASPAAGTDAGRLRAEGALNAPRASAGTSSLPNESLIETVNASVGKSVYFLENRGQLDEKIRYYARYQDHSIYFTDGAIYLFVHSDRDGDRTPAHVKISPENSPSGLQIAPGGPVGARTHYFYGADPSKWNKNIIPYSSIVCQQIYPGIDLVFHSKNQYLEYDLLVAGGADPSQVVFACDGVDRLEISAQGDLLMHLAGGGVLRQKKPSVFQNRDGRPQPVEGNFRILDRGPAPAYSFSVSGHDGLHALVIDPVIDFSTFLGGRSWDMAQSIAVDRAGCIYLTGWTESIDFPTRNAFQEAYAGENFVYITDVFITKLAPSGDRLIYSTFLGGQLYRQGNAADFGMDIAVDDHGNAFVTGYTNSVDFPTRHALQEKIGGQHDAFVVKINAAGDDLIYSTYLGGAADDRGKAVGLDRSGNVWVAGHTYSDNFPLSHPLQAGPGGAADGFVAALAADGKALVQATYLGGKEDDFVEGLSVAQAGNVLVAGYTKSTDFPTRRAVQQRHGGQVDGFVSGLDAARGALVFSTFLGGSADDFITDIASDASGSPHVTGRTLSEDFPVERALQKDKSENFDAFAAKLSADGKALEFSTYWGGRNADNGFGIAVDDQGNIYLTGDTRSTDFPVVNAVQDRNAGGLDVFAVKLEASGRRPAYSTYLGGKEGEYARGIAVDAAGGAYITGWTKSDGFPIKNAYQGQKSVSCDVFVIKLGD